MTPDAKKHVALERHVKARLIPLCVLVFVTVTLGAPTALFLLRLREVQARGEITAHKAAGLIARQARMLPDLWEYNTPKLMEHLRAYRQRSGLRWIVVTNRFGKPINHPYGNDPKDPKIVWKKIQKDRSVLWSSAPILFQNHTVGRVWVAEKITYAGGLLFVIFGALGFVLAFLVYWIPLRVIRAAERRITLLVSELSKSSHALSELNQTLEDKVSQRSSALASALDSLQQKERHLRKLSNRALSLQESERRAIGRELHDETGQSLTAIRINLQLLKDAAKKTKEGQTLTNLAEKTLSILDDSLTEVRRLVARLGPAILDEVNFRSALKRLCEGLEERSHTKTELIVSPNLPTLPPTVETALYRIVQEGLTNIARHAKAEKAIIEINHEATDGALCLSIKDNGRGFDPSISTKKDVRGLSGILERAELLGGEVTIDSAPGKGTHLKIHIGLGS